MRYQLLTILTCGLLLAPAQSSWARKWTDSTGQFSVEAELVEVKDDQVVLKKSNGKVITLPVAKLSETDRGYLKSLAESDSQPSNGAARVYPSFPDAMTEPPSWNDANTPFDLAEFLKAPPAAENVVPLYLDAFREFSPTEMFDLFPDLSLEEKKQVHLKNRSRYKEQERLDEAWDRDPRLVDIAALDAWLANYDVGFEKLAAAQQRPKCMFQTGRSFHSLIPHIHVARQVGRVVQWRTRRDIRRGDLERPLQDLKVLLRLSRDLRIRGMMITQFFSAGLDTICSDLVRTILHAQGIDVRQCDSLLAILAEHQARAVDAFLEGNRAEYILYRQILHDLQHRTGSFDPQSMQDEVDDGDDVNSPLECFKMIAWGTKPQELAKLEESLRGKLLPGAWQGGKMLSDKDYAKEVDAVNRFYAAILELVQQATFRRMGEAEIKAAGALLFEPLRKTTLAEYLISSPRAVLLANRRSEAGLRGTQCLVALKRWQLLHADAPPDIETLVKAAGMPHVPIDPYSDQPLRMGTFAGKPVIYSVGPDGLDDKAQVQWNLKRGDPGDLIFQLENKPVDRLSTPDDRNSAPPTKKPPRPAPEVIAAWEKAGAKLVFALGDKPFFFFKQKITKELNILPPPEVPFGLILRSSVTDAGLQGLARMKQLQSLDLYHTWATDTGLKGLAELTQLQSLDLSNTKVTDAGLKALAGLKELKWLYLDGTKVTDTGVQELRSALPKLRVTSQSLARERTNRPLQPAPEVAPEVIDAWKKAGAQYVNWLGNVPTFAVDKIPTERLSALPPPKVPFGLALGKSVTDAELKGLAGLKRLHTLNLAGSKVTDAGLEELAGLKHLQSLILSNTKVTDTGLKQLGGLTELQVLDLSSTRVTGTGLKHLAGLKQLQNLQLQNTKITDEGMKELAGLARLKVLGLQRTKTTDQGLKELAGFTELQTLNLDGTHVTDAGLKELAGLTELQWLYLAGTLVTDAELNELAGLKQLKTLSLDRSRVTDAAVLELKIFLPKAHISRRSSPMWTNFPQGPSQQVAAAWTKAGGQFYISLENIPFFFFRQPPTENLSVLPSPEVPFGLILRESVTDAALKELAGLTELHTLNLAFTQVTDAGLKELAGLKLLQTLNLTGAQVTDAGVQELQQALPTVHITR